MDRRHFLSALGGSIASGAVLGQASARQAGRQALITTYVSNVADITVASALPTAGSRLALRVDETRSFDPRSVLVSTEEGQDLGYLPPIHSRTIEPLLSAGFDLDARVAASRTMPRPAVRIEISLWPHRRRLLA
jgi:hypothetical protein